MSAYKRQILNYLDHKQRIVELCGGTYGESLSYKRFFPFEYLPEIIEETTSNVCFDISMTYNPVNSTLIEVNVWFFILCHIDSAKIKNEPGLRYDLIAHELTKDFANSDVLGIGKAQILYNKPYVATQKIRGRALHISMNDLSPEVLNSHARSLI